MRSLRRGIPDRPARSLEIWAIVQALPQVAQAATVMAFTSIVGEPETETFLAWCRAEGKQVVLPEDDPLPDPALVDVVVVPGLAFTAAGDRLGQGGGWYDRFLSRVEPRCTTIGVGFAEQLAVELPVEPHDIRLDLVVTDAGTAGEWSARYASS